MNKIMLHCNYYPVFKDISDLCGNKSSVRKKEYPEDGSENFQKNQDPDSFSSVSHGMITCEALVYIASKFGFSLVQTVILLLKNAFEGHVFLNHNIRPEQLSGLDLFQLYDNPESFFASFYEQLDLYRDSMDNAWELLKEKDATLDDINFESLIHCLLGNHVIRFPVSVCSFSDITILSSLSKEKNLTLRNRLQMTSLGERALAEFTQIENVNKKYADKYNEYLIKLKLKEDVLSHHKRKLVFANDPSIKNGDELDSCLYKYLVENTLNNEEKIRKQFYTGQASNSKMGEEMITIRNKIRYLYRLVSKNCSEVHIFPECEKFYPELHHFFLEANNIYNENPSDCTDAVLLYMRILAQFSGVLIYRKSRGMVISEGSHIDIF
jgi:hypothetical protein